MTSDKRILKTKRQIKSAFMELMLEKDIGKITVSDLAERADVNRSTFYLHYEDVRDVMNDIERVIAENISKCIKDFDIMNIHDSIHNMFTTLTELLDNNETVKKYILFSTGAGEIATAIKRILVEKTAYALCEAFHFISYEQVKYKLNFAAAGIVDTYLYWAHENENNVSLKEIIEIVSENVEFIIKNITGI